MRGPINFLRLMRTGATFERTGAMQVVLDAFEAPARLRIALRVLVWPIQWLGYRGDASMPPAARAITALGPAYIKFGQLMSTRPDVVGEDLAMQLRILQDKLKPFPTEIARRTVEEELGRPVEEMFDSFSEPVAAASIAQVHRGTLRETGEDVAIKVLRPGIEEAFRRDLDAFYFVARIIQFLRPGSRRLRPIDVVAHFENTVTNELDFRLETASADEFAENTRGDAGIHVPEVKWAYSDRRVMTLEWVEGIPAGDLAAIDAAGHDRHKLAESVLQMFLKHALRDGLFHADMHQGNFKVAADGTLVAMDFGIMGRIDAYTRRVYAEILFGFIRRDYHRVARVHFEAGYVPAERNVEEFARALRAVGEPIFDMDASRISMGRVLNHLFDVTEKFGMETRTELILLQRTMVVVEGVARSFDPRINFWKTSRPVVERYVTDNLGPKAFARDIAETARVLGRFGPKLPMIVEDVLASHAAKAEEETSRKTELHPAVWFALGAATLALGIALGALL